MPITKLEKHFDFLVTRTTSGVAERYIDGDANISYVQVSEGIRYYWDPAEWDPLPNVYLEIVARNPEAGMTQKVTLWNLTDNSQLAGGEAIVNTTGYQRYRVGPVTMPSAAKEIGVYTKQGEATYSYSRFCSMRLVFIQNGTIKKTVTYIPIGSLASYKSVWADYGYPVYHLFESSKFDNVSGVYLETVITPYQSYTSSVQLHDFTNPVSGSTLSTTGSGVQRLRSGALTISDGTALKLRHYTGTTSAASSFHRTHIIIKQDGTAIAKSRTYALFGLHRDKTNGTTYGEDGHPGVVYWDPANWDNLSKAYYEMTMQVSSGTGYRKLRNRTNSLDIVNGELTTTETSYTRKRTIDLLNDLPASAKELGEYDNGSASNIGYWGGNFLVIEQAAASESTDFLRGYFKANAYAKDFLRGYFAAAIPVGTDFIRGFFAGKGQWDKQFLRAFFASNKESREFLRGYFRTLHESTDKLRGYFSTRDMEGPYVKGEIQLIAGSQALNPGALGVSKDAKIRFKLADDGWGNDHANSGWWCKRREFFRNDAQAEVNLVETVYDKNSSGVVVTATKPLDREHQFDITPAAPFIEGKEVQIVVFSGRDKAGNPGTGKKA